MYNKKIIKLIFLTLLVSCLVLSGCTNSSTVEKVTKIENVPNNIIEELKNIELNSGFYLFNSNFTNNNYEYIAVCSETDNVFDVKITNTEIDRSESHPEIINRLGITIEELSETTTDYSETFELPLVILRFKKGLAFPNSIHIFKGEDEIKMNSWKGSESISGDTKELTYEVIESKEDIPNAIWLKMKSSNFDRGIYEFDPDKFNTDSLYLLISGGDKNFNTYAISLEDIPAIESLGMQNQELNSVVFSLHEYSTKDSLSYTKEIEHPYVLLRIKSKNNKAITIGNTRFIPLFNEQGEDDHLQSFIINK